MLNGCPLCRTPTIVVPRLLSDRLQDYRSLFNVPLHIHRTCMKDGVLCHFFSHVLFCMCRFPIERLIKYCTPTVDMTGFKYGVTSLYSKNVSVVENI